MEVSAFSVSTKNPLLSYMEKEFVLAICVCFLFVLLKVLQYKYIDEDYPPLKVFVIDLIEVFMSSFAIIFFFTKGQHTFANLLNGITGTKVIQTAGSVAPIFTDEPDF
jgi:hypothetical protein